MKHWNQLLALTLTLALCLGLLTGCGGAQKGSAQERAEESTAPAVSSEEETAENTSSEDSYSVVCTIFPAWDWVRELLGDRAEDIDLTLLLDSGVDLHSYQPTAEDMVKISNCDLFVYVGGESDAWVEDALNESANPDRKVISLLDALGDQVREEEVVEGMEAEAEEEESGEDEPEYDEHVWLSLRNAQTLCRTLTEALKGIDSAHAADYEANCAAYVDELSQLDAAYQSAVDAAGTHTLLFGDRFPFRYLVDDYGLDYYAAFVGCSAETEASFETVVFLAGKVDELGLHSVLTIEHSDQRIAQTIIDNTKDKNQTILTMDSLQSTTSADAQQGVTYLSVMQSNLDVLKQALQ